jgi:peptide/nickel transport system permease protein
MNFNIGKSKAKRIPNPQDSGHSNLIYIFRSSLRNKWVMAGFIISVIYFIIAILDVVIPEYLGAGYGLITSFGRFNNNYFGSCAPLPPTISPTSIYGSGPKWWYYFGTTYDKIPLLPAILSSIYIDLGYGTIIIGIGSISGLFIGAFSAYYGGILDEIIMRITDIFFSIPFILIAIGLSTTISLSFAISNVPFNGLNLLLVSLILIWWPIYARLSRSMTLSLKSTNFMDAATTSGSSKLRNVIKHVIPNVFSPVLIQITLDFGTIIAIFVVLEYLDIGNFLGITSMTPELGNLIVSGSRYISLVPGGFGYWWTTVIPVLFLVIFVVGINLLGDGIRDHLDPINWGNQK